MMRITNRLISKSRITAASGFSRVQTMNRNMATDASHPSKLVATFSLPHNRFYAKEFEVDKVIVPATSGQMEIMPGHPKTVAELKPGGLVSIYKGSCVEKYVVGNGYAIVFPNSHVSIAVVEAIDLDEIDHATVRKGHSESTKMLQSAGCSYEKAEAMIGIDVYEAIAAALNISL